MASTTPTGNGSTIFDRHIREAEQQEQAQRHARAQMQQALAQAITSPLTTHRPNSCVITVAWEGQTPVLLIGLPSGDRWDVELSPKAAEQIAKALSEGPGKNGTELKVVGGR